MPQTQIAPTVPVSEMSQDRVRSAQPGGGWCYRAEVAWGHVRRWYLKTFRPGYVRRMASLRRGSSDGAPHEILDPRDLKYCCNLCDAHWLPENDPFAWRDHLPLARWGLVEVLLTATPLVVVIVALSLLPWPWSATVVVPVALLGLVVYFFRDPRRRAPVSAGLVVSPADGKIVEVADVADDPFLGGAAVRISIFLSLFDVHINRAPVAGRVLWLRYEPGAFLSALRPESAWRNESMAIGLEEESGQRRLVVRQISGLVARRIVCCLRPGQQVQRGEKFGMIKLGSRTEVLLRAEGMTCEVAAGDHVRAGTSVLARYDA